MEYLKLAAVTDFDATRIRSYSLFGKKVAIMRLEDGSFQAIEAACKHQGADLTKGEINGNVVTCPRHQWQYDLLSGECLNHDSLPLRRYDLKIEEDNIFVSLRPIDD